MNRFELSRTLALALAATAGSLTLAPQALAQSAEDGAQSEGIAEIVVTAQKREENLQDTPLSIVALGADTLGGRRDV